MAGQVWNSIDENGLAGVLKGVVVGVEVWSTILRTAIGDAFQARTRIAAKPVLKARPEADEAAAQRQNLLPAAAEAGEIVVRATHEG